MQGLKDISEKHPKKDINLIINHLAIPSFLIYTFIQRGGVDEMLLWLTVALLLYYQGLAWDNIYH